MRFSQIKLLCNICTSGFLVYKYRSKTAKYCSQECYGKSLLGHSLTKGKPRECVRGEKHWAWKKDRTQIRGYWEERNNPEYKQWRAMVFKRDRYTCKQCGISKKGFMQADHIKEWAKFPEVRYDLDNGQTLCIPCHKVKTKISLTTVR